MLSEPPGADPHAGWCGRGQGEPGLYPILCGGAGRAITVKTRPYRDQRPYRRSPRSRSSGCCSARAKRSSHRCRDKRCSVPSKGAAGVSSNPVSTGSSFRGKPGLRSDRSRRPDRRRPGRSRNWRFARPATSCQSRPAFLVARASRPGLGWLPLSDSGRCRVGSQLLCMAPLVAEQERGRRPAGHTRSDLEPEVGSCSSARTGSGWGIPWPVRSCPSLSFSAVTRGATSAPWIRDEGTSRQRGYRRLPRSSTAVKSAKLQ